MGPARTLSQSTGAKPAGKVIPPVFFIWLIPRSKVPDFPKLFRGAVVNFEAQEVLCDVPIATPSTTKYPQYHKVETLSLHPFI